MKKALIVLILLVSSFTAASWHFDKWNVSDGKIYEREIPGGKFLLTEESRLYLTKRKFTVPTDVNLFFRSDGFLEIVNMPDCFGSRSTKGFKSGIIKWKFNQTKTIILDFDAPYVFGLMGSGGGMRLVTERTNLLLSVSVDGAKDGNYLYYEKTGR